MGRLRLPAAVAALCCAASLVPASDAAAAYRGATPRKASACAHASAAPTWRAVARTHSAILCLLNVERRNRGLAPLRADRRLARAARGHARDMVRHDYFAHDSRDGTGFLERIRRTGYLRGANGAWIVGENLAWGAGASAAPRLIVRAWMRSPGHRRNILHRGYREIGIAVVRGAPVERGRRAATYVTEFGAL